MKETFDIIADLACREKPPAVYAKQGDADSREVRVSFVFGEKPFDIRTAVTSEMRVLRPDGTLSIAEGTSDTDTNSITFMLTDQMLNAGGEGRIEFVLYGADDEVISSAPARLVIIPRGVGDPAAVSTNEYLEFKRLIEQFTSQFVVMSREEYESMTPSANTVYFVHGDDGAAVYYGGTSVGDTIRPFDSVITASALTSTGGTATREDI